ncbi:MAG: type II secretion system protein [bacterium]
MKKNIRNSAGFTIIELLVVIAIIGVLAAIVLINVTRYIDKGKDAAAKGDLATLLTNAITYYNTNSSFADIASDKDYGNVLTSLQGEKMGYAVTTKCDNSEKCDTDDQAWCTSIQEKADDSIYYCVDSSGAKKESATAICGAGVCPD